MNFNPFESKHFTSCWLKHFNHNREGIKINWIDPLSFVKHPFLPYFINTCSRFTKGLEYRINAEAPFTGKGVYLIYDVLTYGQIENKDFPNQTGLLISQQYPGFLVDLKGFSSLHDYLQKTFSKSSRYKLTKYKKRLETAFDISYQMYWGAIEMETYDKLFHDFRQLLEKRFDEKQETNNNLAPEEWNFFSDVAYPMILEKSAGLFVVYDGDTPIAITLNFVSDTTVFDAITVFDIDYAKFHLGSVSVMGLIEWCIDNGMEILDFSKGEFEYKKRWATREYRFEYHIFYNKESMQSRLVAGLLVNFFRLKQVLRRWKLNEWFHRLTFRLKNRGRQTSDPRETFTMEEFPGEPLVLAEQIPRESPEYHILKPALFEFLYLHSENSNKTDIFKLSDSRESFLLRGANKQAIVRFEA